MRETGVARSCAGEDWKSLLVCSTLILCLDVDESSGVWTSLGQRSSMLGYDGRHVQLKLLVRPGQGVVIKLDWAQVPVQSPLRRPVSLGKSSSFT